MNKLLLFVAPVALLGMTATNVAAGPAGWGGSIVRDVSASTVGTGTPLVLVQRRGGGGRGFAGGGNINRGSINRGNFSNRTFNSGNFQRNVVVNRNVAVVGLSSDPERASNHQQRRDRWCPQEAPHVQRQRAQCIPASH